jgi:hypothetical protein
MIRESLSRFFSLPALLFALALWIPLLLLLQEALDVSLTIINLVTLIIIIIGCLGVAVVSIANAPITLWFPMPWFLLTTGVYYGFGPLLYYFGSPETIAHVDTYYPVTDTSLYRSNMVTLVGIVGVIAIYLLLMNAFVSGAVQRTTARHIGKQAHDMWFLWKVALIFIFIGVPVKIFLVLPRALGLWDVVLPGAIEYLAVLSTIALVPLFLLSAKRRAHALLVFILFLWFELGAAFLQLSKLAILKVAIILLLGWVVRGVSAKRLAWVGVLCFLAYALILSPLVNYGRIAFNVMGLTRSSEAAFLIQDFAGGSARDELAILLPGVQSWWSRLNYSNAQAFAMDAYETGQTGDTLKLAVWTLVPRLLYPDKPVTTTGDKFNELVTGNPESKSAPGMFAEGYWNAGWAGVLFVALVMALCYWGWEWYTRARLAALQFHYLPVIWLGLFSAIQQDSWFVPGTLGIVPIAIAFHWLVWLLTVRGMPLFMNRNFFTRN